MSTRYANVIINVVDSIIIVMMWQRMIYKSQLVSQAYEPLLVRFTTTLRHHYYYYYLLFNSFH